MVDFDVVELTVKLVAVNSEYEVIFDRIEHPL